MPLQDEKHKQIYQELVNVLGTDYVADDPWVIQAYTREATGAIWIQRLARLEFVVLPGSTEDVQQIIRLANRLKFPYSVTTTGGHFASCCAVKPYWCLIDPRRMDRLEIDDKNMYATVEPYVSHAQVQAEAMKRGLFTAVPGASAHTSALANNVWGLGQYTNWRTGSQGDNQLGVEWVLSNGEVLRIGSLAMPSGGYCWGEGPGPDLRGLLRGFLGHHGGLGVVTRVAIKLYPWPGPPVFPTEGVSLDKKVTLPPERFKTFFFTYPDIAGIMRGVQELGRAEIGGWMMKHGEMDYNQWVARSNEEWWESWESGFWQKNTKNMLAIGLWGFASEKQVKYEEKVLRQIIHDTGAEMACDEVYDRLGWFLTAEQVRLTLRYRKHRIGVRMGIELLYAAVSDLVRGESRLYELVKKYTPPLWDVGSYYMFWAFSFGWRLMLETDTLSDKSDGEELEKEDILLYRDGAVKDLVKLGVERGITGYASCFGSAEDNWTAWPVETRILARIKRALDPNNLANPTRLIDMEDVDEMEKAGRIKV